MAEKIVDIKLRGKVEGLAAFEKFQGVLKQVFATVSELASGSSKSAAGLKTLVDLATQAAGGFTSLQVSMKASASGAKEANAENTKLAGSIKGLADTALATQGLLKEIVSQLAALRQQSASTASGLASIASKVEDTAKAAKKSSQDVGGLVTKFEELSGGSKKLVDILKQAAGAFLAFVAIKSLKDIADVAARTETLGVVVNVVGQNAGYSAAQIAAFETEVKALGITTGTAREGITKMIQSGLELGPALEGGRSAVAELARAAQDLAVVSNSNSSETFQSLILNIQQLDIEGLRFRGIIVSNEEAQQKFAQSIGKTADALTQQQKQQALFNAVLDKSKALAGAYEASLGTVGKKVQSLARFNEELQNAIGEKLLPAYGALIDSVTTFLKEAQKIVSETDKTKQSAESLGNTVKVMSEAFRGFLTNLLQIGASVSKELTGLLGPIAAVVGSILDLGRGLIAAAQSTGVLRTALLGIGTILAVIADAVSLVTGAFAKLGAGAAGIVSFGFESLALAVENFSSGAAEGLRGIRDDFSNLADGADEYSKKVEESFNLGESAIGRFAAATDSAATAVEALAGVTSFEELAEAIQQLTEAQRKNKVSSKEVADGVDAIRLKIIRLRNEEKITEEQTRNLEKGLISLTSKIASELAQALRELQLEQVAVGATGLVAFRRVGDESSKAASALLTMRDNAALTRQGFEEAFVVKLDTAKSLDDLTTLVRALEDYKTRLSRVDVFEDVLDKISAKLTKTFGKEAGSYFEAFVSNVKNAEDTLKFLVVEAEKTADTIKRLTGIDVSPLTNELKKAVDGMLGLGKSSQAVQVAALSFERFFAASLGAAKTVADFAKIEDALRTAADKGVINTKRLEQGLIQLGEQAKITAAVLENADLEGPLQELGTSIEQVATGFSSETRKIIASLENVRNTAKLSSEQFYKLFNESLDTAKTLQDLQAFSDELRAAGEAGQLTGVELSSAIEKVEGKFYDLFQAQLKSASTDADFKQLTKTVESLGEAGTISAEQVKSALEDINEAAVGAREETARLSAQMADLAQAEARNTQAVVAVGQAYLDLQRQKNALTKAEVADKQKSTEATRAEVTAQREAVAAAEAKYALAQQQAQLEQANYQLVIALQQQVNAEKAAERNQDNAALQQAVKETQKEVEARKQVVDQLTVAVSKAQQLASTTELSASAARDHADELKDTEQAAAGAKEQVQGVADASRETATNIASWNATSLAAVFRNIGLSAGEAENKAKLLMGSMQFVAAYGERGVRIFQAISDKVAEAKKQQDGLRESAQRAQETYDRIKERAEDVAAGIGGAAANTRKASGAAGEYAEVLRKIKRDAQSVANSAADAARGFASSMRSIKEELLSAQGKEEEAARFRFASRRKELALEYAMLEVKVRAAIITAQAGGADTGKLTAALGEASQGYADAMAAIGELERIEIDKIRKAKAESQREEAERARQAADQKRKEDAEIAAERDDRRRDEMERARDEQAELRSRELNRIDEANNARERERVRERTFQDDLDDAAQRRVARVAYGAATGGFDPLAAAVPEGNASQQQGRALQTFAEAGGTAGGGQVLGNPEQVVIRLQDGQGPDANVQSTPENVQALFSLLRRHRLAAGVRGAT